MVGAEAMKKDMKDILITAVGTIAVAVFGFIIIAITGIAVSV